jgi:hypothetical protein
MTLVWDHEVGSRLSLTIRPCGELDEVWTFPSYVYVVARVLLQCNTLN